MSTEDVTAEIAALLAEHEYMPCSEHTPTVNAWWAQCEGCNWKGPRRSNRDAREDDHRHHLADLLAARDRRVRAEAWDEGHMLGEALAYNAAGDILWSRHKEVIGRSDYRAARAARVESLPHWDSNPHRIEADA